MISLDPPFVKFNTDGNVEGNTSNANAWEVIRNALGKWIRGFSINIGIMLSAQVELWAIRYGLNLAWNMGYQGIQLEVDSIFVIRDLVFKYQYLNFL